MNRSEGWPRVVVIDYGLGNLFSVARALHAIGAEVQVSSSPEMVWQAERLILPGVGAFGEGMQRLRSGGFIDPIRHAVDSGCPLLGICLGMQLLFSESEEFGLHQGLGLVEGRVVRLREADLAGRRVKVPHVGWSALRPAGSAQRWNSTVLRGVAPGEMTYFVHSFAAHPQEEAVSIAQTGYGGYEYCAVVHRGPITGCQFHPEKSGEVGLQILRNFVGGTPEEEGVVRDAVRQNA